MKIYSDKKYLPKGFPHCPLLYPFWGIPATFASFELGAHRFDHYLEVGRNIFEFTGIQEAQAAILPFDWRCVEEEDVTTRTNHVDRAGISNAIQLAEELASLAASKDTVFCTFFAHDDAAKTVPLKNSLVFRQSLLRSARRPKEIALPAWIRDDIGASYNGEILLRAKGATPVVGFCGFNPPQSEAPKGVRSRLRSAAKSLFALPRDSDADGDFKARSRALDLLSRSPALNCEFIIRTEWWNGAINKKGVNAALARESHKQFIANMINSDYIVCARGSGNYSYRFYETLCCGRIPIFINTDCVLPYEESIDWKQYSVWVEERDLPQIADILLEFHEGLTPLHFQELQRACRQLWLDWLSPHGFYANFHRYFE